MASFGITINQINVLLDNGDGTFNQSATLPLSAGSCMSVGYFNGDGKTDIVCPARLLLHDSRVRVDSLREGMGADPCCDADPFPIPG